MVSVKAVKSEGRPLLVAVIPIAVLAIWCFQRLEFHPPKAGEPIEVVASFPISAAGDIVHIVPQEGIRPADGWIKEVIVEENEQPRGVAMWWLYAARRREPYRLQVRLGMNTYRKELTAGRHTYSPPLEVYDDALKSIEIRMRPVKLFGVVPGIPALLFPPWLVAYLILVIPLVPLFKRLVKTY